MQLTVDLLSLTINLKIFQQFHFNVYQNYFSTLRLNPSCIQILLKFFSIYLYEHCILWHVFKLGRLYAKQNTA